MRSREEIESEWTEVIVPAGLGKLYRIFFEILLDIRELLKGAREQSLYKVVSKARRKEENRRRKQVRENLRLTRVRAKKRG